MKDHSTHDINKEHDSVADTAHQGEHGQHDDVYVQSDVSGHSHIRAFELRSVHDGRGAGQVDAVEAAEAVHAVDATAVETVSVQLVPVPRRQVLRWQSFIHPRRRKKNHISKY